MSRVSLVNICLRRSYGSNYVLTLIIYVPDNPGITSLQCSPEIVNAHKETDTVSHPLAEYWSPIGMKCSANELTSDNRRLI